MKFTRLLSSGAAGLVAVAASSAFAQTALEAPGNVGVRERSRPEVDPTGLRMGSFLLRPTVAVGAVATDNALATSVNEEDDTIFSVRPSVDLSSQWANHALNLGAYADITRGSELETEDADDWGASASGRLDVRRSFALRGGLSYDSLLEPRLNSSGAEALRSPIAYDVARGDIGFEARFNRLQISGGFEVRESDYDDGVLSTGAQLDQDFRDVTNREVTLRADYAVSPSMAVFIRGVHRDIEFDRTTPALGERGFNTVRGLVGVSLDLTRVLSGEIGVGYQESSFDNAAFADVDSFSASGNLDWFVSQITTIGFNVSRDSTEPDVGGASIVDRSQYGARVDHELLRNVLLNASAGFEDQDFQRLDRKDEIVNYAVGADWLVNRLMKAGVSYSRAERTSSGRDRDRDVEVSEFGLKLTFQR